MSIDVTTLQPLEVYILFKNNMRNLRNWAIQVSATLNSDVTGDQVIGIASSLRNFDLNLDAWVSTPGFAEFYRRVEPGLAVDYDIVAEYALINIEIDEAVALVAAVNVDNLTTGAWDANGKPVYEVFAPAATAAFKQALDDIVASTT